MPHRRCYEVAAATADWTFLGYIQLMPKHVPKLTEFAIRTYLSSRFSHHPLTATERLAALEGFLARVREVPWRPDWENYYEHERDGHLCLGSQWNPTIVAKLP